MYLICYFNKFLTGLKKSNHYIKFGIYQWNKIFVFVRLSAILVD